MRIKKALTNETIGQLSRFGIAGLAATAIHVIVAYSFITLVRHNSVMANGIAFMVANVFSYVFHTHWSFSAHTSIKNLNKFIIVSFIGLMLSISIAGIVDYLHYPYQAGIALVVMLVPLSTFILHKTWTYKSPPNTKIDND